MPRRLTALIPAHNDDYTLSLCLAAAGPHFDEIIVLDDASTDHTAAVIADAVRRFPCIREVCGGCQLGWIAARNELLKHTDSDWLFWLDADDILCEYNAHLLREIAERSEVDGAAIVRLCLTELWGDADHGTGRLRHFDRCHVFVNRRRMDDLFWSGGTAARIIAQGPGLKAANGPGQLLFHCKGLKSDRRLVERQFVRRWLKNGAPGSIEHWADLGNMPEAEVHRRALWMLFESKGDRIRHYPAGGPVLPAVIRQAPRRFEIIYKDGRPVDRLDHGWTPPGRKDAA